MDSFTFCLRLVHFSSFSRWFSVPTFMHSYDSGPLFSIVGLACCKRFTTFRLPKIINTLYNGSTMRAPQRRAFHLLQAARQLTPFCTFDNPTGSISSNIYDWSDDKHIASYSAVTACGQIFVCSNVAEVFIHFLAKHGGRNNQLISLNSNFLISDNKIREGQS